LQKRPIILSILPNVATPYGTTDTRAVALAHDSGPDARLCHLTQHTHTHTYPHTHTTHRYGARSALRCEDVRIIGHVCGAPAQESACATNCRWRSYAINLSRTAKQDTPKKTPQNVNKRTHHRELWGRKVSGLRFEVFSKT
jgi:hypothetical protein